MLDRTPRPRTRGCPASGRPDRLRAGRRGADRHRRPARGGRRGGASGRDPGARSTVERGDLRQQRRHRTYNVFSAAAAAPVFATLSGPRARPCSACPFDSPPPYIPVDEDYPPRPESTYSLVKTLEEQMAVQFCRWDPELKMVGLRFSNVMDPETTRVPPFEQIPCSASGTCGATSTPGTVRRRCGSRWSTTRARGRGIHHRQRRQRDESVDAAPSQPRSSRAWRSARTSASTRRCCRSTRRAGYSATSRSTPGATRSERGHIAT